MVKKKNSMYINNYEILGYMSQNTNTEESKQNYLNYIQSLINDLSELKGYAKEMKTKSPIDTFFQCQDKLVILKNKLNAETLAEWHNNAMYDLQREVDELRNKYEGKGDN